MFITIIITVIFTITITVISSGIHPRLHHQQRLRHYESRPCAYKRLLLPGGTKKITGLALGKLQEQAGHRLERASAMQCFALWLTLSLRFNASLAHEAASELSVVDEDRYASGIDSAPEE